jgi:hypothetical protein
MGVWCNLISYDTPTDMSPGFRATYLHEDLCTRCSCRRCGQHEPRIRQISLCTRERGRQSGGGQVWADKFEEVAGQSVVMQGVHLVVVILFLDALANKRLCLYGS